MHIRTFLTLGTGEALSRVIAFGAYIYLARVLGAEGYGVISFAAGVNLYLSKVADFAIEAVGASEVAKDRSRVPLLGGALLGARLAITVVLILVSALLVQLTVPEPDKTVLTLFFITLIPVSLSTKWIHLGLETTAVIGVWRVVGESLFLALVITFVERTQDLWIVPLAMLAGDTLASTALYIKLWKSGRRFGLRWDLGTAIPTLKRAFPVMLQILMGLLLYNMDLLFLRPMRGAESVGFYAAAYALISFLANMGMVYGMSLLPAITRQGIGTPGERKLYHTAMTEVLAVTLPVAVGGTFAAHGIITAGFGEEYASSVPVLQVLVWVIPVAVFRNVPWAALIARHDEGMLFRATAVAVGANAVLNLILIQWLGLIGAAIATVATEPLAAGLMLYYAKKEGLPLIPLQRLWKPALATILMAVSLYALGDANLIFQLGTGAFVYGLVMVAVGAVKLKGRLPVLNL